MLNRNKAWRLLATLLAVLVPLGATACGGDDGGDGATAAGTQASQSTKPTAEHPVKLRVASMQGWGALQVHVAEVKGFYEKNGLDVETTYGSNQQAWVAGLGRQFDIAMAAPAMLLAANDKGADVQAVSNIGFTDAEHPSLRLATKEPISSWRAMQGKKVGVPTIGGQSDVSLQYLIEQDGGDGKDITFVQTPIPNQADQLKAGNVDGVISSDGYWQGLEKAGYALSDDVSVEAVKAASGGKVDRAITILMLSSSDWAQQNPEVIAAFRKSLQEGIDWIYANEDEARQLFADWLGIDRELADVFPMPLLSVDVTAENLAPYIKITEWYGSIKPGLKAEDLVFSGSGS